MSEELKENKPPYRPIRDIVNYPIKTIDLVHIKYLKLFYMMYETLLSIFDKEINKNEDNDSLNFLSYSSYEFPIVKNEFLKTMIIGLFHLWLHSLQEFLIFGGDAYNSKKDNISYISAETILTIFTNNEINQLKPIIMKYNTLVNAIKHGPGKSLTKLRNNYKEFFYPSDTYSIKSSDDSVAEYAMEPLVTDKHIKELYNTLLSFWENVPENVTINFGDDKWKK